MDAVSHLLSDPLLLLHVVAAVFALTLAPINLLRRRRDRLHRRIGRTWVAAMAVTALTSFGVQEPLLAFSWLHALSLWTMVSLSLGVLAIRRGNRTAHASHMAGCYAGLWVAFLWAALAPDRTIAQVVAQAPLTAAVSGLLAVLAAVGVFWVFRAAPTPDRPSRPGRTRGAGRADDAPGPAASTGDPARAIPAGDSPVGVSWATGAVLPSEGAQDLRQVFGALPIGRPALHRRTDSLEEVGKGHDESP